MSTRGRKAAWPCLGHPEKGVFRLQLEKKAGQGRAGLPIPGALPADGVETQGLSCELTEEPFGEFPNDSNNSSRLLPVMC